MQTKYPIIQFSEETQELCCCYVLPVSEGNDIAGTHYYLDDSASGQPISERNDISRIAPLLKPEIIAFDYPITFEQYAAILANPYGKITVDGEKCYIQKVMPALMSGMASFELIPAKNND